MFFKNLLKFCSMSLVGRLAGMMREVMFGAIFGVSMVGEAFLVALRLPNLLRTFFADGAVYGAVIPELAEENKNNGRKSTFQLLTNTMATFSIILIVLTVLIEFGAPVILKYMAPGIIEGSERWQATLKALRILFPYLCCLSINTFLVSLLNVLGRYWVHPVLGVILGTVSCSAMYYIKDFPDEQKLTYLCCSIVLAGLTVVVFTFSLCFYDGYRPSFPKIDWSKRMKGILARMAKTSMATFGLHVNVFVDMCLASYLPMGQLTYLLFADRIHLLFVELFGMSMSTVLLPNFAAIKDDTKKLMGMFEDAFLISFQIAVPVACLLFLCSDTLVKLFYGYGKFTVENCYYCARALSVFAIGMPAYVFTRILLSFFFAQKRNVVPIIVTSITIMVNLINNYFLMPKYQYIGLALSTVGAMWVGVAIYLGIILRQLNGLSFYIDLARSILWSSIFGLLCYLIQSGYSFNPNLSFLVHLGNITAISSTLVGYFYFGKKLRVNRMGRTKVIC
jgi:putative peptidoglycan lipid II flippase